MPVKHPFNIYREQLWPKHHGFALWKPNPVEGIYDQVSIGDVGYICEGGFIRMFNVTLPWDDKSNKSLGEPYRYNPLSSDRFAIRRETFGKIDYYSHRVSREETVGNTLAASPDDAECVTYRCRGHGALLSLPNGGIHRNVIQMKVFQEYIKDHVAIWFQWAKNNGLPVKSMENLIFVYGCTLVPSWAAAAFLDRTGDAQVSLVSRTLNNGGTGFTWSNNRGTVDYHDSQLNPNTPYLFQDRCVFIKCLRAKRVLFRAETVTRFDPELDYCLAPPLYYSYEASIYDSRLYREAVHDADEPFFHASPASFPDALFDEALFHGSAAPSRYDPNSRPGPVMHLTEDPDDPEYLDPLIGVLNYIADNYPKDDHKILRNAMAVAHDNDLQLIEMMRTKDSLTGDVVENFLNESKIPVLLENGVMTLQYPQRQVNEHGESDESSD